MKKMWPLAFFLLTVVLLIGCGKRQSEGETLRLFYPKEDPAPGGDIIDSMEVDWSKYAEENVGGQIAAIVSMLLNDNQTYAFSSPLPKGTKLLQCTVSGGLAVLNFSPPFERLSGMKRMVADYCLTLSITQIPGVRRVQIVVDGRVPTGWKGSFSTDDVLLTSQEDVVKIITVSLYFPDAEGILHEEQRDLSVHEGENRCGRVVEALLEGPKNEELWPLFPDGVHLPATRMENGICYIGFDRQSFYTLGSGYVNQQNLLDGLVQSLCKLDGVEQVQILCDGGYKARLGTVDISGPLTAE